jgi:3-deoxy-7-phosphoheptulonate synthase
VVSTVAFPATAAYHLFPSPETVLSETPLPAAAAAGVARSRDEVRAVLNGTDDRLLVMRAYFEKPRTVTGWTGLLSDPGMDLRAAWFRSCL